MLDFEGAPSRSTSHIHLCVIDFINNGNSECVSRYARATAMDQLADKVLATPEAKTM